MSNNSYSSSPYSSNRPDDFDPSCIGGSQQNIGPFLQQQRQQNQHYHQATAELKNEIPVLATEGKPKTAASSGNNNNNNKLEEALSSSRAAAKAAGPDDDDDNNNHLSASAAVAAGTTSRVSANNNVGMMGKNNESSVGEGKQSSSSTSLLLAANDNEQQQQRNVTIINGEGSFRRGPSPPLPPPPNNNDQQQLQQRQQLQTTNSTTINNNTNVTPVHGIGLWNSWTRNFGSPLLAMWDLVDNAIDASCSNYGRVHIDPDDYDNYNYTTTTTTTTTTSNAAEVEEQANNEQQRGIRIQNTCLREVAPVKRILWAYLSEKAAKTNNNDNKSNSSSSRATITGTDGQQQTMIGENGVGVKQGCATLSDLSFVVTRNGTNQFGLGILAKELQTPNGIYLPSWNWESEINNSRNHQDDNDDNADAAIANTYAILVKELFDITKCLQDPALQRVFATYGGGWKKKKTSLDTAVASVEAPPPTYAEIERGIRRVAEHYIRISDPSRGQWGQHKHVFCLVLHDMKHHTSTTTGTPLLAGGGGDNVINGGDGGDDDRIQDDHKFTSVSSFLDLVKKELPRQYLHVLQSFDLRVNSCPVIFSYWPRRLAELTQFDVIVDTRMPVENGRIHQMDTINEVDERYLKDGEYKLRVYVGFDPIRAADDKESTAASLAWYSRTAGRLIKQHEDARGELNLVSGGSDYAQGLTIIVDDINGRLPLNPTKQDFAFGEQARGVVHQRNLKQWIAAIVRLYYQYHLQGSFGEKRTLTERVKSQKPKADKLAMDAMDTKNNNEAIGSMKSIGECVFNRFTNFEWRYKHKKLSTNIIVGDLVKKIVVKTGEDSIMDLSKAQPKKQSNRPPKPQRPKSRDNIVPDISHSTSVSSTNRRRRAASTKPVGRLRATSTTSGVEDGNVDYCVACDKAGGTLVCCALCPRAYHFACLGPNVDTDHDPWKCVGCIQDEEGPLDKNIDGSKSMPLICTAFGERQDAISSETKAEALRILSMIHQMLLMLMKHDFGYVFKEPVDPQQVPHYLDEIKQPMDLGTIVSKLLGLEGYPQRADGFDFDAIIAGLLKDVELVWRNCQTFNQKGDVYYRMATVLRKYAQRIQENSFGPFLSNKVTQEVADYVSSQQSGAPNSEVDSIGDNDDRKMPATGIRRRNSDSSDNSASRAAPDQVASSSRLDQVFPDGIVSSSNFGSNTGNTRQTAAASSLGVANATATTTTTTDETGAHQHAKQHAPPDPKKDPLSVIDSRIAKYFGHNLYFGTISDFFPMSETGSEDLWHVYYEEDGDTEDFALDEVLRCMELCKNNRHLDPLHLKNGRNREVSSSRTRPKVDEDEQRNEAFADQIPSGNRGSSTNGVKRVSQSGANGDNYNNEPPAKKMKRHGLNGEKDQRSRNLPPRPTAEDMKRVEKENEQLRRELAEAREALEKSNEENAQLRDELEKKYDFTHRI